MTGKGNEMSESTNSEQEIEKMKKAKSTTKEDEILSEIHADAEELKHEAQELKKETEEFKEEVKNIKEAAAEIKKEAERAKEEDFKSKYYYLAAEMENMKRRFQKEKENLIKFGNERVLTSLLGVVDNLDRTVEALGSETDEKVKNIITGVDMVRKQFMNVLSDSGMSTVETVGKQFDPNFHEAMAQQPAKGKNEGEIITEFQKGYILNGRLLRAAKVVIVKN